MRRAGEPNPRRIAGSSRDRHRYLVRRFRRPARPRPGCARARASPNRASSPCAASLRVDTCSYDLRLQGRFAAKVVDPGKAPRRAPGRHDASGITASPANGSSRTCTQDEDTRTPGSRTAEESAVNESYSALDGCRQPRVSDGSANTPRDSQGSIPLAGACSLGLTESHRACGPSSRHPHRSLFSRLRRRPASGTPPRGCASRAALPPASVAARIQRSASRPPAHEESQDRADVARQ